MKVLDGIRESPERIRLQTQSFWTFRDMTLLFEILTKNASIKSHHTFSLAFIMGAQYIYIYNYI